MQKPMIFGLILQECASDYLAHENKLTTNINFLMESLTVDDKVKEMHMSENVPQFSSLEIEIWVFSIIKDILLKNKN